MSRARVPAAAGRFLLLIFGLLFPFSSQAIDLGFKIEPGVALSMGSPQTDRFNLGGAASLKALAGAEGGYFNVAAGITFLGLSAESGYNSTSVGTAWAPSLGIRLQLPRESDTMRNGRPPGGERFFGARPWVDADLMYVRTGSLDRVGYAGAVGLAFPMDQARAYWLGPFVRYFQVISGDNAGFDNRSAHTLIIGVSLETRTRVVHASAEQPIAVAVAPPPPSDRDGDGVPDDVDACPDMKGPASNSGCPVYAKVIVKPDKLELKEKIQFLWNDGILDPISYPALDEVAQALQDNQGFSVGIEGHASSEGSDDHNQSLSTRRAEAVREYIAGKGVSRDRLFFKGFSSSRPIQSNDTEAGRVANRRVEFVVHFVILKEGSAK